MSAPNSSSFRRILLAVATSIETRAILSGPEPAPWTLHPFAVGVDLIVTGIGKANAAGAVARFLDPARYDLVLNAGIAGTLGELPIGQAVIATSSIFADDGVQTPQGFLDCASMGFPLGPFQGPAVPATPAATQWLARQLPHAAHAPIATVSTCSGTDQLAAAIRSRTSAAAEAMEGAAIGLIASRLGVAFAEVRTISNTTGDRPRQQWDIKAALNTLSTVIGTLAHTLREGATARER